MATNICIYHFIGQSILLRRFYGRVPLCPLSELPDKGISYLCPAKRLLLLVRSAFNNEKRSGVSSRPYKGGVIKVKFEDIVYQLMPGWNKVRFDTLKREAKHYAKIVILDHNGVRLLVPINKCEWVDE